MYPPKFWYSESIISLPLRFLSSVVGTVMVARRAIKNVPVLDLPSFGVGSLACGGAGKTTLSMTIAEKLQNENKNVWIIHSGYGGKISDLILEKEVDIPISDEVYMMLKRGFKVGIGKDRKKIIEKILKREEGAFVIFDDFFSYLDIYPKIKIIVFTNESFGNGLVMPFGPLREPLISLKWADFVLVEKGFKMKKKIEKYAKVFEFELCVRDILYYDGRKIDFISPQNIKGMDALGVSAIALPQRFLKTSKGLGVNIKEYIYFPDHYFITEKDLYFVQRKNLPIFTTEKDFWKILNICTKTPIYAPRFYIKCDADICY